MTTALPPAPTELTRRLRLNLETLPAEDMTAIETALALASTPDTVAARWPLACPPAAHVVILKAARREFENPRGAASESVGGHYVALADNGASGVYLTGAERHLVARLARSRRCPRHPCRDRPRPRTARRLSFASCPGPFLCSPHG